MNPIQFPKFERQPVEDFLSKFCPQLMLRLYPVVKWISDKKGRVVLLVNLIDRSVTAQKDKLIYAGIETQYEQYIRKDLLHSVKVVEAVKSLGNYSIFLTDAREAGKLYEEFRRGDLSLDNIPKGILKEYFEKSRDASGNFTNEQEFEYPFINSYIAIETGRYVSLPLIQFGQFDGVVHIIYEPVDEDVFEDKKTWRQLIRLFSMEYEGLLIDWDLVGGNIEKKSQLEREMNYLMSDQYLDASSNNPIFSELNYRQYYIDSYQYYLKRVGQNDEVPRILKQEHRKRAIIAILIDSYAHNISAHSLTVLKWWFQQRAGTDEAFQAEIKKIAEDPSYSDWGTKLKAYLAQRFPNTYTTEQIEQGILADLARWMQIVERLKQGGPFLPVRDQFLPLAEQLHPLFKFLLEKGAFWSGITRDQQFGGEIRSLYDVLWHDFVNNPLYLGTIAYSEGITKLNIHFRFYSGRQYEGDRLAFKRIYQLDKTSDEETYVDGWFATINVGDLEDTGFGHTYVQKGDKYELLKQQLQQCQVFLPGGVVGKHAMFTLLENEIRNVKHYPIADLEAMQKNGLDLYIGIRPGTLSGVSNTYKDTHKQLFKVGIWIHHMTALYDSTEHLISKRLKNLMEDIIAPDTNQAKLGGNYQDKICAAMLFNNTFTSVQNEISTRDQHYYPWIRSAYSEGADEKGTEVDFEVQGRNLQDAELLLRNRTDHAAKGYFKKYFHLWQGKQLFELNRKEQLNEENIARFKIVSIRDASYLPSVREHGVIRVLEQADHPRYSPEVAYHRWLQKWLKEEECRVKLIRSGSQIGHLVFDEEVGVYINQRDYMSKLSAEQRNIYADYPAFELNFAHGKTAEDGERDILKVRSHGVLVQKFFDQLESINDFDRATIWPIKLYELLEVIQTEVCIFDNRVAERLTEGKRNYLAEQLKCGIYKEDRNVWEAVKAEGWDKYHFIVVHLSFIEAMLDNSGKKYNEAGIVHFLEEQLGQHLGVNCIFVVTTGRGREEWWRTLQKNEYYSAHSTFRPVEMLIEAVETGGLIADDIDLKYNLVKVLFGS